MAHMDRVKEHLAVAAHAHRKTHEEALREAAIARAEAEAANPVAVPQAGLQGPPEDFWAIGEEH